MCLGLGLGSGVCAWGLCLGYMPGVCACGLGRVGLRQLLEVSPQGRDCVRLEAEDLQVVLVEGICYMWTMCSVIAVW